MLVTPLNHTAVLFGLRPASHYSVLPSIDNAIGVSSRETRQPLPRCIHSATMMAQQRWVYAVEVHNP